jgi:SAM-dependent methyltransferase
MQWPVRLSIFPGFTNGKLPVKEADQRVMGSGMIDVRELLAKYSLAELIKSADDYFAAVDVAALARKPFNDLQEAPEVVLTFLHVLKGLRLQRGAVVLDFGAGSCWSSEIMAGFGYKVIASDVSERALAIGRAAVSRRNHPYPVDFLLFDGLRLDLPDESVDAITCLSAFHHVPNPDHVIREFARVLKPGGVAGLSEPGPNHSRSTQAQDEMRSFVVVENDVNIDAIWKTAREAGFSNIEIGLFYPEPHLMPLPLFKSFLGGGHPDLYVHEMRQLMQERRLFFMEKGTVAQTSLEAGGLEAVVSLSPRSVHARPGHGVSLTVEARNTGTALWRPSDWPGGPVRFGTSIIDANGNRVYGPRWFLPETVRPGVLPNATVSVTGEIQAPLEPGEYEIAAQLVSEFVAWFGQEARARLVVSDR